jgi:hypothetical protein
LVQYHVSCTRHSYKFFVCQTPLFRHYDHSALAETQSLSECATRQRIYLGDQSVLKQPCFGNKRPISTTATFLKSLSSRCNSKPSLLLVSFFSSSFRPWPEAVRLSLNHLYGFASRQKTNHTFADNSGTENFVR